MFTGRSAKFHLYVSILFYFLLLLRYHVSAQDDFLSKNKIEGDVEKIYQPTGKDFKWSINKRHENRFLGDTPGAIFVNVISIVSGILTIWGWIETREKFSDQPDTDQLIEEWTYLLNDLSFQTKDIKLSIKQLNCRLDFIHSKSKTISRECLQFIQHHQPNTGAITKPPKKNPAEKNTYLTASHLDSLQRVLKASSDKINEFK